MTGNVKNIGRFEETLEMSSREKELFAIYKRDLPLILEIVDDYINENGLSELKMADFGGGNGGITQYLKENSANRDKIIVTCIDSNSSFLEDNKSADIKIEADLKDINENKKWDIGTLRYVLEYNTKDEQLKILKNIHRSLKDDAILINWNVGLENEEHQRRFQRAFSTTEINEKYYRPNPYWDTIVERKKLFKEAGFKTEVKDEYRVNFRNFFAIRYELSEREIQELNDFLGKYDFAIFRITVSTKATQT